MEYLTLLAFVVTINGEEFKTVLPFETTNTIVDAESALVATIGLDNVVVVQTDTAVLVARKDKAQDVKRIVELLERKKMRDYL